MKELLKMLELDSSLTNKELAVMLNETEEDIHNKIKKLQNDGIIKGYKAIIDWEKAGYEDSVYALIEIKVSPKKDIGFDDIANKILKFKEVVTLKLMSGSFDLAVIVKGDNIKDIAMFISEKLASLESVLSTSTIFELKTYKLDGFFFNLEKPDQRGLVI